MELKNYLGIILSQVTEARMLSDLKSTEVAKNYLKDDFLRHFAVPRMRIENLEINIPIAVSNAELGNMSKEIRDRRELQTNTYNLIKTEAVSDGLKISQKQYKNIISDISKEMEKLSNSLKKGEDSRDAINLYKISISNLSKKHLNKDFKLERLRELVYQEVKPTKDSLGRLDIIAESDKLNNLGQTQTLLSIKMVINEEGMEWVNEESDGSQKSYLLPE